jgi:hypothetical protein
MLPENVVRDDEHVNECFMTALEYSIAYCRCREAVTLFRFMLSPYSLVGNCSSVQNCTCRWPAEIEIRVNLLICRGFAHDL